MNDIVDIIEWYDDVYWLWHLLEHNTANRFHCQPIRLA